MGKPEGRKPLGRPRRRWEDNIKMDLREVGCDPGGPTASLCKGGKEPPGFLKGNLLDIFLILINANFKMCHAH